MRERGRYVDRYGDRNVDRLNGRKTNTQIKGNIFEAFATPCLHIIHASRLHGRTGQKNDWSSSLNQWNEKMPFVEWSNAKSSLFPGSRSSLLTILRQFQNKNEINLYLSN